MELTTLAADVPRRSQEQEDALAALRGAMPDRLWAFADRYVVHFDAAQAAADVGAPGQARELLADRRTLVYLQALMGQFRESNAHVRAGLVRMLVQMAAYDPKGALGPAGWLPFAEWPDQLRMCVEGIEFNDSGGVRKVKFTRRLDVVKLLLELTGGTSGGAGGSSAHRTRVVFEQERG